MKLKTRIIQVLQWIGVVSLAVGTGVLLGSGFDGWHLGERVGTALLLLAVVDAELIQRLKEL